MLVAMLAAAFALDATPPPGFQSIFNGKDLTGWHGQDGNRSPFDFAKKSAEENQQLIAGWTADARKHWTVENGELVNDGNGIYLATDKDYRDFELLIDYKTVAKADSGIYLKASPQVQIWDTTDSKKFELGADKGSGGLWNNSPGRKGKDPLVKADKPLGEWNSFRIKQVGAHTWVWLNGQLVVDDAVHENYWDKTRMSPLMAAGPVMLQTHGGEIRWRNIHARAIPAEEANALLRGGDQGFGQRYDCKSMTGWSGPVQNYEIKDDAIVCKPGMGGVLHTAEEFADFVARVEFKLPPGGNNGLAIRYPGKGDPAYVAMTEIQILDDTHPKYKAIDPRQTCGSVYGMAPAQRGYLRPTGEWNLMEVTAKGSTLKVELNGSVINDVDVSKIEKFMANSPHPGKDRTSGYFGFAGHSDPVAFRNVAIKKL
jgi:hypothetical protein